jgi:hypothetical protein
MTTAIRRISTTSCRPRRRDAGSTNAVQAFSANLWIGEANEYGPARAQGQTEKDGDVAQELGS